MLKNKKNIFASFIVFSYCFEQRISRSKVLKKCLEYFNMAYIINIVPQDFNKLNLPKLILDNLNYFKKPILFVPLNTLFIKEFKLNKNIKFDVGYLFNSNIMVFNYTDKTIKYLKNWIYLNNIPSEIIKIKEFTNIQYIKQINEWDIKNKKRQIKLVNFTGHLEDCINWREKRKKLIQPEIKINRIKPSADQIGLVKQKINRHLPKRIGKVSIN
jgi:hypothetical protein